MSEQILKHRKELARHMANGNFEYTDGGILILGADVLARGVYIHSENGGKNEQIDPNLLPEQGLHQMLDVVFGAAAKPAGWYLAIFSGQINPADGWTAANFAATANEITSATEGYSNATRPQFTPSPAAAKQITNFGNKALFNIVCATSITIEGAALLSNSGKGSTSGALASGTRFAQPRTQYNGDVFELGYGVALAS